MNFQTAILAPREFEAHCKQEIVSNVNHVTPAGTLKVSYTRLGIFEVQFVDEQNAHSLPIFNHKTDNTLLLIGTDFQVQVWHLLLKISTGTTLSYSELAHMLERPQAGCSCQCLCPQYTRLFYPLPPSSTKIRQAGRLQMGYSTQTALA